MKLRLTKAAADQEKVAAFIQILYSVQCTVCILGVYSFITFGGT